MFVRLWTQKPNVWGEKITALKYVTTKRRMTSDGRGEGRSNAGRPSRPPVLVWKRGGGTPNGGTITCLLPSLKMFQSLPLIFERGGETCDCWGRTGGGGGGGSKGDTKSHHGQEALKIWDQERVFQNAEPKKKRENFPKKKKKKKKNGFQTAFRKRCEGGTRFTEN